MKKLALVGAIIAGLLSVTGLHAGEAVTLSGKGVCAKCHLKSAGKCGPVLQVTTEAGTKNYAVTGKGAKKIRGKQATVKGEVSEANGQLTIAATEITIGKK